MMPLIDTTIFTLWIEARRPWGGEDFAPAIPLLPLD
jgi:hypothetical protein